MGESVTFRLNNTYVNFLERSNRLTEGGRDYNLQHHPDWQIPVIPFQYLDEKNGYHNLLLQKRLRREKISPFRI